MPKERASAFSRMEAPSNSIDFSRSLCQSHGSHVSLLGKTFAVRVASECSTAVRWYINCSRDERMGLWMSWLALLLIVGVTLTFPACTSREEAESPREQPIQAIGQRATAGTYRRPLGHDPSSLDPVRITDFYAVTVANQIYDSLVEFDAHLNVLPALAQSWSASRDGLVWTFHLRKGVQFHNGREVTANDVVYSLSRFLDPSVKSPRGWLLDKVKRVGAFQIGTKGPEGIQAIDSSTVQITLSEPFAPFITILGLPHMSVIPREEVERLGVDFASSPVGTGPFRLVRWERGREIILAANKDYFRGRPALDRIQFIIFPGNAVSEMVRAFELGELEETPMETPISPERREELLRTGQYIVVRKPTLSLRLLGFNLEHLPFNRREVRQAFNYAIDKFHLNQEIQEKPFAVAKGILPPGMPGYNPEVQGYRYNPDRARELLAQAGYPEGKGLAPVMFASGAKSGIARQDYRAVQQYLAAVGVQVELKEFDDWPTFRQALQHGEHQIFRYARYADYPDPDNFLYPLFHSQSQTNYFRYRNPLVDRLLDDARREMDDLRRARLYRDVEQLILNDAPGVMLQHNTYEYLFQPYVEGIEVSALGEWYMPMRKIRLKPSGEPSPKR